MWWVQQAKCHSLKALTSPASFKDCAIRSLVSSMSVAVVLETDFSDLGKFAHNSQECPFLAALQSGLLLKPIRSFFITPLSPFVCSLPSALQRSRQHVAQLCVLWA
jgi:hypothetical protein